MPTGMRLTFRPRHRLMHARQFQALYRRGVRHAAGPLVVFAAPNDLSHPRLGLSVGRRVGGAVRRNRVKRLLREAFRRVQHELPGRSPSAPERSAGDGGGWYDYVVTVRPHEDAPLEVYMRWLLQAAGKLHAEWSRRGQGRSAR